MVGGNTIKLGYIWRVGDGKNINIWSDPWIPQAPDRMVITRRGGQLLSKVADLINPPNGEWAESLVNQTFWPIDARRILAIPLAAQPPRACGRGTGPWCNVTTKFFADQ